MAVSTSAQNTSTNPTSTTTPAVPTTHAATSTALPSVASSSPGVTMPTSQRETNIAQTIQNRALMRVYIELSEAEETEAFYRSQYDSYITLWHKINGQLNRALNAADLPEITVLQQLIRDVHHETRDASDALMLAEAELNYVRARMGYEVHMFEATVRPVPMGSTPATLPHNNTVSPAQPPSAASSRPAIRTMLTLPYDVREMIHDYGRPTANEQAAHARSDYIIAVVANAVQFLQPAARSWFNTILSEGLVAELDPSIPHEQAIQLAWATRKEQNTFGLGDPQWAAYESRLATSFLHIADSRTRYRQRTNSDLPTPVHRWVGVPSVPVYAVPAPGVPIPVFPVAAAAPAPAAPAAAPAAPAPAAPGLAAPAPAAPGPAASASAAPAPSATDPATDVVQAPVSSRTCQAARRQRRLSGTPRATPIFIDEVGAGSDEVSNPANEDDLLDQSDDENPTHRQRRPQCNRAQRQQLSRAARRGFSSEDDDPFRSGLCRYVKQKRK